MRWLLLLLAACASEPASQPDLGRPLKDQVDILVVLDDSNSTTVLKRQLTDHFPDLLARLDAIAASGHPASYHFGVITSDLGAGPTQSGCTPDGLGGRL